MATPEYDTQADIIPKHKIIVFSKLKSFQVAQEKVRELLEEIVMEDNYMGECVIEKYQEKTVYSDAMQFTATTAVVVVDPRQTRALITPYRRDKAVDHWDELNLFNSQITEPKGSILIVIYGDKKSENLETKLIADKWLTTWTHGDPLARDLALRERCFSIWDKFNKLQKGRITQFLREQPILPNGHEIVNTLVFGDPSSDSVLSKYLKEHPLINYFSGRSLKPARLHEAQYGIPSFKQDAHAPECTFAVWYCDAMRPVEVCSDNFNFRTDFPLTESKFKKYSITNSWKMGCSWSSEFPEYDNVIVHSHCDQCFIAIYDNMDSLTSRLKEELGKAGIVLKGEVIPIVSRTAGNSQEVIDKARLLVLRLARQGNATLLENHKIGKIERERPDCVLKLLAWYACQTSISQEGGILATLVNRFSFPLTGDSVYRAWTSAWDLATSVYTWVSDSLRTKDSRDAQYRRSLLDAETSVIEI